MYITSRYLNQTTLYNFATSVLSGTRSVIQNNIYSIISGIAISVLFKKIISSDYFLTRALDSESIFRIRLALMAGANPNLKDNDGNTALHISARDGREEVVTTLLEKGANPNLLNNIGVSALILASNRGLNMVVATLLANGANPNFQVTSGYTALHFAALNNHSEVVATLLANGANPNFQDNLIGTPLNLAISSGHSAIVKNLLANGADPNLQNNRGNTALHRASSSGHSAIVENLLANGADPNLQNIRGDTPLHLASRSGHSEVVATLLEKGANVNAENKNGKTPLRVVCSSFSKKTEFENPKWKKVIRYLVSKGADLNKKDSSLETSFHLALKHLYPNWFLEVNQVPIEKGINQGFQEQWKIIPYKDRKNQTSIKCSHKSLKKLDFIRFLISQGASPFISDNNNWNPFLLIKQHPELFLVFGQESLRNRITFPGH